MRAPRPPQHHEAGLTLLELVVSLGILSILAAAAAPLYGVSIKREREIELRRSLRDIRRALDAFHESYIVSGGAMPFPTARQGGPGGGAPTAPTAPNSAAGGAQNRQPGQPSGAGQPAGGRARPGGSGPGQQAQAGGR